MPLIMLMLNNPGKMEHLTNALAQKHIILRFPGVGGIYHDNRIDYIQIKEQKTTIGEIDGKISNYTQEIKVLFDICCGTDLKRAWSFLLFPAVLSIMEWI